ncbi:MAG TPA: ABC transporter ATP-binding protein [Syntrophorhabdaceae bacterium]|nr:ABC transporter ATP-binding protein [Syntrophorhabdaceae bacterium]
MFFEVKELCRSFGALQAVHNVSFTLDEGTTLSIIGPNGAGKTTLFNVITGVFPPDSGEVMFKGTQVTGMPPDKLCHKGIARSFQITNIFQGLSVFENIRLACQGRKATKRMFSHVSKLKEPVEEAEKILDLLGLLDLRDSRAGTLSHGDQRYLEIGMTLAAKPSLVLFDEPTAGMTPMETKATIELIHKLKGMVTIIIIEHDINMVFAVSDRILVMDQGNVLADGPPEEVKANEAVKAAYFGEEI